MAGNSDFNTRQVRNTKPSEGEISEIWMRLGNIYALFTPYEKEMVENCSATYSDLLDEPPQHAPEVVLWSELAA